MTLVILDLDADVVDHIALAVHRHRIALRERGYAEPAGLREFEQVIANASKRHKQSASDTDRSACQSDSHLDDRTHLTRSDVHTLTGASLRTIDRWIATEQLPSTRHGRIRRIARTDLDAFLKANPQAT